MQQQSFASAIASYQKKRTLAWALGVELANTPHLALGPIRFQDAALADTWSQQWTDQSKRPTWQWTEMFARYNQKSAFCRFEVAVRVAGRLCALAYGMPSNSKLILRIHALERAPQMNPLAGHVLPVILATVDAYARILGSREIWICNPMNPRIAKHYENYDFTPVIGPGGATSHLIMRLSDG